jgi:hypothetical protein
MRIACWVSVFVCASSACADSSTRPKAPPAAPEAVVAGAVAEQGRTRLTVQIGDARASVILDRDATVAPDAAPRVDVVAKVPATAIVVVDKYASMAGGLSYCQAGEEAFLRVISTTGGTPVKQYDMKVASCRDNLELADPGIEWDSAHSTLRVHWLFGPNGKEEERRLAIRPDGRVEPAGPSQPPA